MSHIQIDAVRLHAIGNALQFLLVLLIDMRPEHLAGGAAEEFPITLRLMCVEQLDRLEYLER